MDNSLKPELHSDISNRRLAIDYWLVTHLDQIKKIFISIFIVLDALLIVYSLWGLVSYGVFWYQWRDDLNTQLKAKFSLNSNNSSKPQDLLLANTSVLVGNHNTYDLVTKVKNPNSNWGLLELSYYFKYNSGQTATSTTALGPNQETYLSALGLNSDRRIIEPELVIINQAWSRIKSDQKLNDLNLAAVNAVFHPGESGKRKWVTFNAKNLTTNNYQNVVWQVALLNGQTVVGYNNIVTDQLPALTEQEQEVSWFEPLPAVTGIEIIPYLNVFDSSIIYSIPGQIENNY